MSLLKVHPLPNSRYTDGFNPDRGHVPGVGNLGPHRGIDMAAPAGAPIRAAHDGVVRRKFKDVAGGNLIYLTGQNGKETFETSYQHMIQPSPLREGQRIRAGQIVGYVGKTGYANGNHLHFELWRHGIAWGGGTAVDPLPFLSKIKLSQKIKFKGKSSEMIMIHRSVNGKPRYAIFGGGLWLEFTGSKTASNMLKQMTGRDDSHSVPVTASFWNHCKKAAIG